MSLFSSDEQGTTEPYTDLPALGLVAIGLLIFAYVVFSAYSSYESKAYYADRKEDLRTVAIAIAADPSVACRDMSGVLEAQKLDNISVKTDVFRGYGIPGDTVTARVDGGISTWSAGNSVGSIRSASYNLPVTVRLNDARCIPGLLTVTVSGDEK